MGGEEAVDDGVGGRIERRQGLDEGCHCDVGGTLRDVSIDLKQVEHDVRRPAENEHCGGENGVRR